jgi:hypothetical protein
MDKLTIEELLRTVETVEKAMPVAGDIIDFLESRGVDMDVGVIAAGIAFSSGASSLGASLPSVIELVRVFYKQAGLRREAH